MVEDSAVSTDAATDATSMEMGADVGLGDAATDAAEGLTVSERTKREPKGARLPHARQRRARAAGGRGPGRAPAGRGLPGRDVAANPWLLLPLNNSTTNHPPFATKRIDA